MHILIFNVGSGQCIFFYPKSDPSYTLMVDCGNIQKFEPIDKIIEFIEWKLFPYYLWAYSLERLRTSREIWKLFPYYLWAYSLERLRTSREIWKLFPYYLWAYSLGNLTLTNYDEDHFSGFPYLKKKVKINSFCFPGNLTSADIKRLKEEITEPIEMICDTLDGLSPLKGEYAPPYEKYCFYLKKSDFPEGYSTNDLSQIVFVSYKGTTICIPGDLTAKAWEKLLLKEERVRRLLEITNIFVASHHGREDGYNEEVFNYCRPECIILSDKEIEHETQERMTEKYRSKVLDGGIIFNSKIRKVLTTRDDGHIWIELGENGARTYKPLAG